jgi:hypothetical protein
MNTRCTDRLKVLAEFHALAEASKQKCIHNGWRCSRQSGETLIVRDVFEKIVKWIDIFCMTINQDNQYDSRHAALPWATAQFVFQVRDGFKT